MYESFFFNSFLTKVLLIMPIPLAVLCLLIYLFYTVQPSLEFMVPLPLHACITTPRLNKWSLGAVEMAQCKSATYYSCREPKFSPQNLHETTKNNEANFHNLHHKLLKIISITLAVKVRTASTFSYAEKNWLGLLNGIIPTQENMASQL